MPRMSLSAMQSPRSDLYDTAGRVFVVHTTRTGDAKSYHIDEASPTMRRVAGIAFDLTTRHPDRWMLTPSLAGLGWHLDQIER